MKKSSRVEVLLFVLAFIELSKSAKARDLIEATGYSRTAMFRLMRVLRDELGVVVDVVHGKGYVISEWGVLNKKAVIQRNEELVKSWIEKRS
jgi:hypothetical protein